jgi:ferric-dicitrate binding protein FerR (iron transport regulator)
MRTNSKYHTEKFILRWIKGLLGGDEEAEFQNWLLARPGEQQYFHELREIWQESAHVRLSSGLTERRRWQKILRRIEK